MAKRRGRKAARKATRAARSAVADIRRHARRFWHQGLATTSLSLYTLYLAFLYFTNRPLPAELAVVCTTPWVRGLMVLLLVWALYNRDVASSALLFVAYFFTCWLASRNPWEFMENAPKEDEEHMEDHANHMGNH